jgi:hydroxyacylglutathione hydrolase
MTAGAGSVIRIKNRVFASNTYICSTSIPGECIIIDPGLDPDAIEAALLEAELVPQAIFCTHGHFDHIGSAEHFRRRYSVAVHFHGADLKVARSSNFLMMAFKVPSRVIVPEEHVAIEDGFTWQSGQDHLEMIHVPGHTPGSCVVSFRGHAFTGDTVYRDGVGLVSLPGENLTQLVASIRKLWDLLPDSAVVHPGHGGGAPFEDVKRLNLPLRQMLGIVEPSAS